MANNKTKSETISKIMDHLRSLRVSQKAAIIGIAMVLCAALGYQYANFVMDKNNASLLAATNTASDAEDIAMGLSAGTESGSSDAAGREQGEPQEIAVHVKGAVAEPGVYTFPAGTRVEAAVAAASPVADADLNRMNLAAYLTDGIEIIVPYVIPYESAEEAEAAEKAAINAAFAAFAEDGAGSTDATSALNTFPININTATASQIQALPGIGDVKAAAVVAYRQDHGQFTATTQIKNVSGIGNAIYEQIKDLICVE